MRLQLHFQGAQLCLHDLRPELGCVQFELQCFARALLVFFVIAKGRLHAQNDPVCEHALVETEDQQHSHRIIDRMRPLELQSQRHIQRDVHHKLESCTGERESGAEEQMQAYASRPGASLERPSTS
jgi:hypothetical protein